MLAASALARRQNNRKTLLSCHNDITDTIYFLVFPYFLFSKNDCLVIYNAYTEPFKDLE